MTTKRQGAELLACCPKTVNVSQTGACQAESAWASPAGPTGVTIMLYSKPSGLMALLCPLSRLCHHDCCGLPRPVCRWHASRTPSHHDSGVPESLTGFPSLSLRLSVDLKVAVRRRSQQTARPPGPVTFSGNESQLFR